MLKKTDNSEFDQMTRADQWCVTNIDWNCTEDIDNISTDERIMSLLPLLSVLKGVFQIFTVPHCTSTDSKMNLENEITPKTECPLLGYIII